MAQPGAAVVSCRHERVDHPRVPNVIVAFNPGSGGRPHIGWTDCGTTGVQTETVSSLVMGCLHPITVVLVSVFREPVC